MSTPIDSNDLKPSEQEAEKSIPFVHTSCKDCIFAEYNDNVQSGCKQNRLNKFKKEQKTDETDNKIHFLLEGICNFCRNQDWKDKAGSDYLNKLKLETCAKVDLILINTESTLSRIEQQIERLLNEISQNQTKVCSVTFSSIVPINYSWYNKIVEKYSIQNKVRFHVVKPVLSTNLYPVLDMCVSRGKGNYYLSYYLNTKQNLSTCIDYIDNLLNVKLQKFIMIQPHIYDTHTNDIDGLLVQRYLHKLLGGNSDGNLVEKINILNKEQKENMVISWEDVQH